MSLIKGKQEFRTILDFSYNKISKSRIRQALRQAEVVDIIRSVSKDLEVYTFVENEITVGMYQIRLLLNHQLLGNPMTRLKEYGGFRVAIYERNRKGNVLHNINLDKDKRFQDQRWVELSNQGNVRTEQLVNIILHLKRLNALKMFL